ncbi:hypothetical protein A9404_10800 [Halothiobacillus diazotrophicus]|uniref:Phosphate ABC transporter substrate-binding protein n=1 Tax=Halothiobacillus diazotrophicus TaxID=1860122 RepID=A0A191ZIT3_9GAMM|nr:phosphate/phosphite/phosphonate ABC transporter substrate-binding protein [Halothiobacillus diazotrophicus]ANJ67801.1 hypothetical protein A9404_10800 [Halothiobacillus diazotrophicus]
MSRRCALPTSRWVLGLVFVLFLAPVALASPPPEVFTFGVAPQQSPSKLAGLWGPLLREISHETGVVLQFKTAASVEIFEKRLLNGDYDIAYMNPYHYLEVHRKLGYQPVVRARDRMLTGIVVTRRDAPYRKLADLSGQVLAFPAPTAFAATILIQAELARQHVAITPKYVSSHDSVYLDVAQGLFPAGGGIMRTFNALDPHVRDDLRVIYETRGYTPHAIAASPRVPADVVAKLQAAFEALGKNPQGRDLLAPLRIEGWVAAKDSDWNDVRDLCKTLIIKPVDP